MNIGAVEFIVLALTTMYKNKYNVLVMFILYCKTLLLLLSCETGKVRDRFVVWVGLSVGLGERCVNNVIINITEIIYRHNYKQVFLYILNISTM